jgi:hypothetical protein
MILFFITTFIFLFGLGYLFATVDRQEVMAHWDERRCDLPVMIVAGYYQPKTSTQSSTEFATDNFTFCMDNMIKEVFAVALAPFINMFKSQMDAAAVVQEIQNSMRGMIAKFQNKFSGILEGVFNRYMSIGFHLKLTYKRFMDAMNRVGAIAVSTLFMGISMVVGLDAGYNFMIKVVMIIMGIIIGMIILLFVVLIPFFPLIFGVLASVATIGLGAGMGAAFCFAANTPVVRKDGTTVPLHTLVVGDYLQDGSRVDGIIHFTGKGARMYILDGIRVSGDHLVFYNTRWITVTEHPDAIPIESEDLLICLNTDTHTIRLNTHLFADWEEIPPDRPDLQKEWNRRVAYIIKSIPTDSIDAYPLFSSAWQVNEKTRGLCYMSDIRIGDEIEDVNKSFTAVLGLYTGDEEVPMDFYWYSDSIWWENGVTWKQTPMTGDRSLQTGVNLITDSGTFRLFNKTGSWLVRDFTEVGHSNLSLTYDWMKNVISNKKPE